MSGNEASAIGSLRAINSSQQAFSSSCANGFYAHELPVLGLLPIAGGAPFISPDLSADVIVNKSGYDVTMAPGSDSAPAAAATANTCQDELATTTVSSYYATGNPVTFGSTGSRYFWTNTLGTIYTDTVAEIGDELGNSAPVGNATTGVLQ
jgi:hypothetical protein